MRVCTYARLALQVNSPGHFVLRLVHEGDVQVIDVFRGGRLLTVQQVLNGSGQSGGGGRRGVGW